MQPNYSSVLVPADVSTLSFETDGNLGQVNLSVGQVVRKGDVLAELEKTSFAEISILILMGEAPEVSWRLVRFRKCGKPVK